MSFSVSRSLPVRVLVACAVSALAVAVLPASPAAASRPSVGPVVTAGPAKVAGEVPLAWSYPQSVTLTSQRLEVRSATPGMARDGESLVLSASARAFTVTGLTPDRGYRFRVRGVNQSGVGVFGPWVNTVSSSAWPVAPSVVAASVTAAAPSSATVTWSYPANVPALTSQRVEVDGPDGSARDGDVLWVRPDARAVTVTGLTRDTVYSFKVRSVNQVGMSQWSSSAVAGPPAVPSVVAVTPSTSSSAISWSYPVDAPRPSSFRLAVRVPGQPEQQVTVWNVRDQARSWTFPLALTAGSSVSVRAVNGLTASAWSPQFEVAAPTAPTGLTVTASDGSVEFAWDAPTQSVSGFEVRWSGDAGVTWSTPVSVDASQVGYTASGLVNGTAYVLQVRVVAPVGASEWVSSPPVTPVGLPQAPSGLSASPGENQVSLSWSAPVDDGGSPVTGYVTRYRPFPGQTWSTPLETGSTATSVTLSGFSLGVEYWLQVAAVTDAGVSPWSAEIGPVVPATVPDAPLAVVAVAADGALEVSWTAPMFTGGSTITDYVVEYGESSEGPFETVADGVSSATSATITGLVNGTEYWVRVSAVNTMGPSSPSTTVSGIPAVPAASPASAPTGLTASTGTGGIDVAWSPPADDGGAPVEYYQVEQASWTNECEPSAPEGCVWFGTSTSTSTSWKATSGVAGASYLFRVRAYTSAGFSPWSQLSPEPAMFPFGGGGCCRIR